MLWDWAERWDGSLVTTLLWPLYCFAVIPAYAVCVVPCFTELFAAAAATRASRVQTSRAAAATGPADAPTATAASAPSIIVPATVAASPASATFSIPVRNYGETFVFPAPASSWSSPGIVSLTVEPSL